jgi:hypothetical protein
MPLYSADRQRAGLSSLPALEEGCREIRVIRMRPAALLAILVALAACTKASVDPVDARTFTIKGPIIPGSSDAPNRRAAMRVCPNGYRVIKQSENRNPFGEIGVETDWTIRCL